MPQMPPDDAAAVARAKGGDHEAFRLLVDRHSRSVFRLAYRMTGRVEDAEDIVQETFVRAYRRLGRFESRANFGTWLYRIGVNCAIDYLRARPARESVTDGEVLARVVSGREPEPDDLVFAGEIGRQVQAAMRQLTAQERAAFLMRHYHGCSIEEICTALNLRTNAAKHSIFRAVRKMRLALRPLLGAAAPAGEAGAGGRGR